MLKGKKRCQILNKKYLQSRDEIGFFLTSDNEVKKAVPYRPLGLAPAVSEELRGVWRSVQDCWKWENFPSHCRDGHL